jgi:hypothetical protein
MFANSGICYDEDGMECQVFEFAPNGDLFDYFFAPSALRSFHMLVKLASDIANGVQHVHAKQVRRTVLL